MNKAEIVAAVAEKTGLTKKDTENTINEFIGAIEKELWSDGEEVDISEFLPKEETEEDE